MADSQLASQQFLGINESVTVCKNWAHSQSKLHKTNFRWTIHNFSFLDHENGKMLRSPTFSSDSYDKLKWLLQVFPKGYGAGSKDWLSVYLELVEHSVKSKVIGKANLSIIDAELKKQQLRKFDAHNFEINEGFGYSNFTKRDFLMDKANKLLPGDKLTIDCEVSFVTESECIVIQKTIGKFKIPECKLIGDFGDLLDNHKFSDVTLVVDEHEFPAHKAILSARSDVFSAMFQHEMEESISSRVTITDVDWEALKETLRFIYTGDTPKLSEMANRLLAAADKYSLEKLKAMAEEALFSQISIETAAETLVLADLYSANQLKEQTICFFVNFAKDIIKTKGWQKMVSENAHSLLISEALDALISK